MNVSTRLMVATRYARIFLEAITVPVTLAIIYLTKHIVVMLMNVLQIHIIAVHWLLVQTYLVFSIALATVGLLEMEHFAKVMHGVSDPIALLS